jgi:succinate dehydrogenase/fumarate reductase flavoprotein subunit
VTQADVVVVGSGGAALIAAVHAAMRGAKVVVLEKAPIFGGTTAISGGGQWVPGNPLGPETFGLRDTRAEVETYLAGVTAGLADPARLSAFLDAAPAYIEFFLKHFPGEVEAADIPDYNMLHAGAKGPGRAITMGLYDSHRLGSYRDLMRLPPLGGIAPIKTSEEAGAGWVRHEAPPLAALAAERRARGITARGAALAGGLLELALAQGVELVSCARARALVEENGRIVGVLANREGRDETFSARRGVMLASGGFEWNPNLWKAFVGTPLDGPLSPPYNEGDGLLMAVRAGARLGNMRGAWWFPADRIPGETFEGAPRVRNVATAYSITVNRRGRRFYNENTPYGDSGPYLTQFDHQLKEFVNYPAYRISSVPTVSDEVRQAYFDAADRDPAAPRWYFEADSLANLAEQAQIDPGALEATVVEWNRNCDAGRDPLFHRGEFEFDFTRSGWEKRRADPSSGLTNPLLRPLGRGPFFATRVAVGVFGTNGGVVTDGTAAVVGNDGSPIQGLFAAGNVTANIFGPAYPGAGATLGPALTMGWVAGRSMTT